MAIKGRASYRYYCYTGRTATQVVSKKRKYGAELDIISGTNFGLRISSDGKKIRMVLAGPGNENDVYTLTDDQHLRLVRNAVAYDHGYIPNNTMAVETLTRR